MPPGRGARKRPAPVRGWLDGAIMAALSAAEAPMGSYDLLRAIGRAAPQPLYPNQIYRALERLIRDRRVVRIESAASYMPSRGLCGVVLLCGLCGAAMLVERLDLHERLAAQAQAQGFALRRPVLEMVGRCPACLRPGPP